MSNPQLSSYSGFNLWSRYEEVGILLDSNNLWFWYIKDKNGIYTYPEQYFEYASDAEQDLITFLKNYERFRNG